MRPLGVAIGGHVVCSMRKKLNAILCLAEAISTRSPLPRLLQRICCLANLYATSDLEDISITPLKGLLVFFDVSP